MNLTPHPHQAVPWRKEHHQDESDGRHGCEAGNLNSCYTARLMLTTSAEAGFYPNPILKVHGHGFNKRLHSEAPTPRPLGRQTVTSQLLTIKLSKEGQLWSGGEGDSPVESPTWHLVSTLLLQLHFSASALVEGGLETGDRACLVVDGY